MNDIATTTTLDAQADGYAAALDLLHACSTVDGFVASPQHKANYHRVWARDGAILALAALLSDDASLITTARHTLETLARHQGPHGEIPSNVDPTTKRISYGGTTGRVDADLWFVIVCGELWHATGDDPFIERMLPALERVRFLLGAWEFNDRGLLFVPQTGDWADEYLHHGYVLYDQLLYLQAQRTLAAIHAHVHGSKDHALEQRVSRLRHLIQANYWFHEAQTVPDDVYHEILFEKGRKAASRCDTRYWMPSFSPTGYGYRFDAFANVLASLLQVADADQQHSVDAYIDGITPRELRLLPAFHPVISPVDRDWDELKMTFSFTFKNQPHEYHNGGLWPMITGFYVADLARRGLRDRAERHLAAIHQANALAMEGETWGFPEYVHGTQLTPGGTRHQGWSAAAAVLGQHAVDGRTVFRIDGEPS